VPSIRGPHFVELLRLLARNDVELIVVGVVAAVMQGAPVTTYDIDLVHRRTPENVSRLLRVLQEVDAVYRGDPRNLTPTAEHLLGTGHQLMESRLGDVDCLGAIDDGAGFDELLAHSVTLDLGEGLSCRVLALSKLIEIKRRAGRPKDVAALPVLEATLDELRKKHDE